MSGSPSTQAASLHPGDKKLRIAVLNRTFSPSGGGAERYSIAMVEQLAGRNEMHVFAQEISHQWPGVTYHRVFLPFRKPRWLNQLWFAFSTWRATRCGFDVVHSHENTWHGDVQTVHVIPVKHNLFHGRTGTALALRWLKVATSPRLLTYLLLEHFRYAEHRFRSVVITSNSLKAVMSISYPACKPRLHVITPGISMPGSLTTDKGKKEARALLGLPITEYCMLFVANNYLKKGLTTILQALAQLPVNTVLAVAGNTDQILIFKHQAAALKVSARVFFLGSIKDIGLAYQAADCLVHPTLEDTFAMVVLEAMAYGLPVIVSGAKYCGISELLTNGVNAVILEGPKNVRCLKEAILNIVCSPLYAGQLSNGAIEFAKQYEWRELAASQEALYLLIACEKAIKPT